MSRKPRPNWEWLTGITREHRDLAVRRSEFLVDGIGAQLSLRDLLANAYLQGLIDAAEVMAMREDASPAKERDGSGPQGETL